MGHIAQVSSSSQQQTSLSQIFYLNYFLNQIFVNQVTKYLIIPLPLKAFETRFVLFSFQWANKCRNLKYYVPLESNTKNHWFSCTLTG